MIEQRFGTVTGLFPLRVRMDGDSEPLPVDVITLVSPHVGDRVSVRVEGTMRIVDGILGGPEYVQSGALSVVTPAWTVSEPPIYSTTATIPKPFTPPPDYGFEFFLIQTSGFTHVSTANHGAGSAPATVRITQFHNASLLTLTIGWRLVRAGT